MNCCRFLIYCFVSTSTLVFADDAPEYYLDQFAPSSEEREGWLEARQLLEEFVATPEFMGRNITEQNERIRENLDKACSCELEAIGCQIFIRQHRSQILTALPNNPLYWQRFWFLFQVNPHAFISIDDPPSYQQLIPATYWWFYRDLAQDGKIEIEDALTLQTGLNRWLKSHHTMIARMITIAMRGIAYRQINYAMAQASRDRDEGALSALIDASSMLPPEEISFGKLLWMEREYGLEYFKKYPANPEGQSIELDTMGYDLLPGLDPEAVRQALANPIALHKSDSDIFAKHYIAESVKPWTQYWSEGIFPLGEEASGLSLFGASIEPAHTTYIATDRYSNFYYTVFAALGDIYAGTASPGLPGRPAPTHWRWDWQEGSIPMICLVSDVVHPTTKQGMKDDPEKMCLEYFDEKFVSEFMK